MKIFRGSRESDSVSSKFAAARLAAGKSNYLEAHGLVRELQSDPTCTKATHMAAEDLLAPFFDEKMAALEAKLAEPGASLTDKLAGISDFLRLFPGNAWVIKRRSDLGVGEAPIPALGTSA